MMWSVTVGFLYIANSDFDGCLWMVMSRKLISCYYVPFRL